MNNSEHHRLHDAEIQPRQNPRWSILRWVLVCCAVAIIGVSLLVAGAFAWQSIMGSGESNLTVPNVVIASSNATDGTSSPDATSLPGILGQVTEATIASAEHPLDPFLEVAKLARKQLLDDVRDYTAIMSSEVRLENGKLREPQIMQIKIRHQREEDGSKIPFSIYSKFLSPPSVAGQEVIWVENANDGNLIAHPPGLLNWTRAKLDPNGSIAMSGNRHPIYEMGMARLFDQMLTKGTRDRESKDCEIRVQRDAEVNGRKCLRLTILHEQNQPPFDFYQAIIYVDIEHAWPIGYEAFDWPTEPGGEPLLIERYFYSEIEINKGFDDHDFDPDNEEYNFPG